MSFLVIFERVKSKIISARDMKTRLIFILILFLSCTELSSQIPQALEKNIIINQNIKSQTQINFKFENGKPKEKGYKNAYKEYDRNGNVVKEEYYRRGDINQELSYEYNKNQDKTEYVNYSVKEDEIRFKQTIDYNAGGKKVKERRFNGSEHRVIDYNYNDQGKLSEIIKTDPQGNLVQRRIFSYDGNVANIKVLNNKGNIISRIVNKYDNRGNLIEYREFKPNGERTKKITYKFNDKNNKTEETKYQKGNFIYRKNFKYNNNDQLVEIHKEQPKGKVHTSKIYSYNDNGLLAKEMWYDSMAEKYSHKKYFYNNSGIVKKARVYYAFYDYKVLYRYKYKFYD
jgi:hypothetical protein